MNEDKWTPLLLIALLVVQLVFLGALYVKLTAIQENLFSLNQTLAVARNAPGGAGGGLVEETVPGVEPGDGPWKGSSDAPVTIVEFSDFSCKACRAAQPRIAELLEETGEEVRLVYRHFPLRPEGGLFAAAVAAECAHRQSAFWPMHDLLFGHEGDFDREDLIGYAKQVGLDTGRFVTCMDSEDAARVVRDDRAAGASWGVSGTPTFFINGRRVTGLPGLPAMEQLIEEIRREDAGEDQPA
jgi:protein-disulfide isomerase